MIEVYTDGGSRGNPGKAAYGFVVYKEGEIIKKGNGYIGIATNNYAEYTALVEAFNWLRREYESGISVNFYLDSQLVVNQLNGLFKVKNHDIREFVLKIRGFEKTFKNITYKHVPREMNKEADAQVNLALDAI